MSGPEETFGPPDERLREALERELGEVPAESPSEPQREPPSKEESSSKDEPDEREPCEKPEDDDLTG